MAGTFNATLLVEDSDDGATYATVAIVPVSSTPPSSTSTSITGTGKWYALIRARWMRIRCSAFTSNTSSALTAVFRNTPPPTELLTLSNAVSVTGAVTVQPSGGTGSFNFTNARIASAATTNATSVKGSAGNLYSATLSNTSASAKFVKFYNKATAPTVGTDTPIWTVLVAAGATITIQMDMNPLRFSTGIAYAITGAVADADTTAVAANDVHGFLNYA